MPNMVRPTRPDRSFLWGAAIVVLTGASAPAQWSPQVSGTESRPRGLHVVSDRVVWAVGNHGTVLRTVDGGGHWVRLPIAEAAQADLRDVHALDDRTAWVLAVGVGTASRLYMTTDGGTTWTVPHVNPGPDGFLDAVSFRGPREGLILGDPVEGRFVVMATEDGGRRWVKQPLEGMPRALPNEAAFAASGTCLVVGPSGRAWFGTGGGATARVFRSTDGGMTWTAHEAPIRAGSASRGIFGLGFRDADHGVAVGGDYQAPDLPGDVVALTSDGGRSWRPPKGRMPSGYRSAVACLPGTKTWVAVGPSGTDLSEDDGESWRSLGRLGFDAVSLIGPEAGWAVGEGGRIARFSLARARLASP